MRKINIFLLLIFFFLNLTSATPIDYIKVDEVKSGMIVEGKTILEGNETVNFQIKISGLISGMFPYADEKLIIGRIIKPDYFKKTGVIAGMSGSPVYYKGKIIGAVSFTFPFLKEPVAGITPFEYMLSSIKKYAKFEGVSFDILKIVNFNENKVFLRKIISNIPTLNSKQGINIPLYSNIPLKKSGVLKNLQIVSGGDKKNQYDFSIKKVTLKDGDPINVLLSTGDVEIAAGGTVTKVIGNKFYAFGHSFLGLGKVNYPVTNSDIVMVVAGYESSFRLGNSKDFIGMITEDKLEGITGEIGKLPDMIDVEVNFFYKDEESKTYRFKIVKNNLLSPNLIYLILQGLVQKEVKLTGDMSFEVDGSLLTKDDKFVNYSDVFSGWSAGDDMSLMFGVLSYYLMNNGIYNFDITDIAISITPREKKLEAELTNVFVNKYRVNQGDTIELTMLFRTQDGKRFQEKGYIKIPPVKKGSKLYILIGDSNEMSKFDKNNYRDGFKFPDNPDAIIRALNNLRKNSIMYFKVFWKRKSLFINGYDYSNIPKSLFKLMLPSQKDYKYSYPYYSVFREYSLPMQYKVKGKAAIELEIE